MRASSPGRGRGEQPTRRLVGPTDGVTDSSELEIPDLPAEMRSLLRQIPRGRVTTYGELARTLGDVRAARWVGEFLRDHPHDATCNCHRVVRADGGIGLFHSGKSADKRALLVREGVSIVADRASLDQRLHAREFESRSPLQLLQQSQSTLAARVRTHSLSAAPMMYCGLDVAYDDRGVGYAAAVLMEADSLRTVAEVVHARPATFPYIPGYLTFRELPFLLEVWEQVRPMAAEQTVCLVDGNGQLHPRRAGIACGFGVLANVPTIGVAKSLLCGRAGPIDAATGVAEVADGDELLGLALLSSRSRHPLYVSVGHAVSLSNAEQIVTAARTEHHLPEPTHRADQLSKRAKRGPKP